MGNKNKDKKEPKAEEKKHVTITAASLPPTGVYTAGPAITCPKSPKMTGEKKEWFDPEASEVDYDKNPTDLFQALEARQFSYAEEMFKQVNKKFTKDCKTWVVARGQKKKKESQLRFRALPLHPALVFGATDDMIVKILNAYPLATRGRDIKGRLPIHLAMEHDASEQVVCLILEAFPKGFFAKDKKDMAPLDYVDGNMKRAEMKKVHSAGHCRAGRGRTLHVGDRKGGFAQGPKGGPKGGSGLHGEHRGKGYGRGGDDVRHENGVVGDELPKGDFAVEAEARQRDAGAAGGVRGQVGF